MLVETYFKGEGGGGPLLLFANLDSQSKSLNLIPSKFIFDLEITTDVYRTGKTVHSIYPEDVFDYVLSLLTMFFELGYTMHVK